MACRAEKMEGHRDPGFAKVSVTVPSIAGPQIVPN